MVFKVGYKDGQQVVYDPSDPLSSYGVTPAQTVQTQTQLSPQQGGQVIIGTTLQPAPPQTGTFTQPTGGTIEQKVAQEAIIKAAETGQSTEVSGTMQTIGTEPYAYGIGISSALAAGIVSTTTQEVQPQPTQDMPTILNSIDETNKRLLATTSSWLGMPVVSTTGETLYYYKNGRMITTEGRPILTPQEMSDLTYNVNMMYEKSSNIDNFLLNLQTAFSPRGLEYIGSFVPSSTLKPEEITKQQMLESRVAKTDLGFMERNAQETSNWIIGQGSGALTGSLPGVISTSLLTSNILGAFAGATLGEYPSAMVKLASLTSKYPLTMKLTPYILFGGYESIKDLSMAFSGVPQEKIIGSTIGDIGALAAAGIGFKAGFEWGYPTPVSLENARLKVLNVENLQSEVIPKSSTDLTIGEVRTTGTVQGSILAENIKEPIPFKGEARFKSIYQPDSLSNVFGQIQEGSLSFGEGSLRITMPKLIKQFGFISQKGEMTLLTPLAMSKSFGWNLGTEPTSMSRFISLSSKYIESYQSGFDYILPPSKYFVKTTGMMKPIEIETATGLPSKIQFAGVGGKSDLVEALEGTMDIFYKIPSSDIGISPSGKASFASDVGKTTDILLKGDTLTKLGDIAKTSTSGIFGTLESIKPIMSTVSTIQPITIPIFFPNILKTGKELDKLTAIGITPTFQKPTKTKSIETTIITTRTTDFLKNLKPINLISDIPINIERQFDFQTEKPIHLQTQAQLQSLTQITRTITPTIPITDVPNIPNVPNIPPTKIPTISFPSFDFSGGFDRKMNQVMSKIDLKTRYKPSLRAIGEGIFAKGKKPKIVSGFGFRPIFKGKKGRLKL